jgi:membrane associated rhomboid family serine protease
MRLTETVKQLLIINIIMFIGTSLSGDLAYSLFGLHFPKNASFHFWQVISHMFMHGSLSHILLNMFALWMFGIAIEGVLGSKRFLFFYISCGLGAAIIQIIFLYFNFYSNLEILINAEYDPSQIFEILNQGKYNTAWSGVLGEGNLLSFMSSFNSLMVGASGAIMGVLVAFGMFFPENKLILIFFPVPIKAKYFIPGIILIDLISAISGVSIFSPSNTAFVAHLGGALTGFLIMYYWKRNQFNSNRWY